MIDYAPVGAIGQAAENVWDNRPRQVIQRMGGTLYGGTPDGPAGPNPVNAGTGQEVHGAGYIPGQVQYTVPGGDQQQGTDAGSGAIDPATGQPIDQTAAAMPAAPTTYTVSAQQKQQLANIDANTGMSDFDKNAARRKVLGQPAQTVPYTVTQADGTTSTVNLTPQQAQQATAAGQKIQIAQQQADTRTAAQKEQADYHGQLIDVRNQNLAQRADIQNKQLDEKNRALEQQYQLAMNKSGDATERQVYKMGSDEQKALEGALHSDTTRAREYLQEYITSHKQLSANDPELLRRQQMVQQMGQKEAAAKYAWQQNLAQNLAAKTQTQTAQQQSAQPAKAPANSIAAPTATDAQGNRVQWNGSAWVPLQ